MAAEPKLMLRITDLQQYKEHRIVTEASHDDDFPEEVFHDPNNPEKLYLHRGAWLSDYHFPNRQRIEDCMNIELRPSDVLVVSFPKSGTTWIQEIVYRIMTINESKIENEINIGKPQVLEQKFPMLEDFNPGIEEIKRRKSPRLIKTHQPFHLLPIDAQNGLVKMIYIARNPMDILVSYYYFVRHLRLAEYRGEFKDLFDNFINGKVSWGPWPEHVADYWNRRNDGNLLFLTYEQLHKNHHQVVRQVAEFLSASPTEAQVEEIVQGTKFESMKQDESLNYTWWNKSGRAKQEFEFMRKGQVGDWRNYFTAEMTERINKVCLMPLRALNLNFDC